VDLSTVELEALYQATKRLETRWELPLPADNDFYIWDPLPWAHFIDGIRIASEASEGRRFLDVGCGFGTKLAYMNYLGWETAGIDKWPHYIDGARELCPFSTVTLADLFDIDIFDADVVYTYRPGRTDETQAKVEEHIVSQMPPGALLFLACRQPDQALPLQHIAGEIWRRA
jgi:SAM-dependent methyltransferase